MGTESREYSNSIAPTGAAPTETEVPVILPESPHSSSEAQDKRALEELRAITPAVAKLRELAAKYPPPPEWFEGDEDRPF
jgi:hypothetical protein